MSTEPLDALVESDPLGRFILSERHFAAHVNRVKAVVFLPAPQDNATSVFAIRGLAEEAVWRLGEDLVARPRGKPLWARADLLVSDVRAVDHLEVVLDNWPPRHANIIRWPDEKSAQKSCAQELAARATLRVVNPSPAS